MGARSAGFGRLLRAGCVAALICALAVPIGEQTTTAEADDQRGPASASSSMLGSSAAPAVQFGRVDLNAIGSGTTGEPRLAQATGDTVAPGAIGNYYRARGGERTFGPPISGPFRLLGADTQLFRNFALRVNADGSVSTMGLLDMGAIPSLQINGRTLPPLDTALAASAPSVTAADYATASREFIRTNAPDTWEGVQVGFYYTFLATVTAQEAFPDGGANPDLLPGFAREVWGIPVSRPTRDPQYPDLIYLRWERGVMEYNGRAGQVQAVPLGEVFKAVLTGENIPSDLAVAAQSSPFYRQFDPAAPNGVARPAELPDTSLQGAFQSSGQVAPASVARAPTGGGALPAASYPTSTPIPYPSQVTAAGQVTYGTPTPTIPPGGAFATPTPTPTDDFPDDPTRGTGTTGTGTTGTTTGSGSANSSGPAPSGTAATDVCTGQEQITFSPEGPRAGNELLIAVSSSQNHRYGRLVGTERTSFVRARTGQLGYVWEWTVNLTYPGDHEYTYYVDSTVVCKKATIRVGEALATRTPTPVGADNGNTNSNVNANVNVNSNDNNGNDNVGDGADLSVTVDSAPNPASRGDSMTYTVTVVNAGPDTATEVRLVDTLPSNPSLNAVSVSTSKGSCSRSDQTVTCDLDDLSSGNAATITITGRVPSSATSLVNTATVNSNESDPDGTDNTATQTTFTDATPTPTPTSTSSNTDMSVIFATTPAASVKVNDRLTYAVTVRNAGPAAATGVTLVNTLSGNVSVNSVSPTQGTCTAPALSVSCNLNSLGIGGTAQVTVVVTPSQAGSLSFTAVVDSSQVDPNTTNDIATHTTTVTSQ